MRIALCWLQSCGDSRLGSAHQLASYLGANAQLYSLRAAVLPIFTRGVTTICVCLHYGTRFVHYWRTLWTDADALQLNATDYSGWTLDKFNQHKKRPTRPKFSCAPSREKIAGVRSDLKAQLPFLLYQSMIRKLLGYIAVR